MILKQGFHAHPKTVLLRQRGGSAAVEALQQVWLFAENARTWRFPNWKPDFVAAVGSIYGKPDLADLLLDVGFLDRLPDGGFELHDFDQHNAALIQRWQNGRFGPLGGRFGKLGGRPRNPRETPGGGSAKPPVGGPKNPPTRPDQTRPGILPPASPSAEELPLEVEPQKAINPTAPRKSNPLFDALSELDGGRRKLTKRAAGAVGTALAEIQHASPDVTPNEIQRRAGNLRLHFPNVTATASSLAKHWARCVTAPEPSPVNGNASRSRIEALTAELKTHPANPSGRSFDVNRITPEQEADYRRLTNELATLKGQAR